MLGRDKAKADGFKRSLPDVHPFNPTASSSLGFENESGKKLVYNTNRPLTCITSLNSHKHLGRRGQNSTSTEKAMETQIKEASWSHTATKEQQWRVNCWLSVLASGCHR